MYFKSVLLALDGRLSGAVWRAEQLHCLGLCQLYQMSLTV